MGSILKRCPKCGEYPYCSYGLIDGRILYFVECTYCGNKTELSEDALKPPKDWNNDIFAIKGGSNGKY